MIKKWKCCRPKKISPYLAITAPEVADKLTRGSSVQWYTVEDEVESTFPEFSYGVEFNETNTQKVTICEVVVMAASVATKNKTNPRGVY